jgi:hypothetical protein
VSAILAHGGAASVLENEELLGKGLARAVAYADKYVFNRTVHEDDVEEEEDGDGSFDPWDEQSTLVSLDDLHARSLKRLKKARVNQFSDSTWKGDRKKPKGRRCWPDVPSKEDRVCERHNEENSKKAAGCLCKTTCHVWGDPHIASFYSKCSNLVMTKANTKYLLWRKPADKLNQEVKLEIETIKQKGKVLGRYAYHNGVQVFDASNCLRRRSKPDPVLREFKLYSDAMQLVGASKRRRDISVKVEFRCRNRRQSKGIPQLEAILELDDDQVDAPDGGLDSSANITSIGLAPTTTSYFQNDEGLCTDAVLYDAPSGQMNLDFKATDYQTECNRQSSVVETSGRQCSCSAECAAWGDPYFHSFYENGCRSHHKCGFEQGKFKKLSARSFAYVAQDKYAVEYIVNECNMISGARVYFMKEDAARRYNSCTEHKVVSSTSENLDWNDFDVYEVLAKDVCSRRSDTNKATRKYIEVPSPNGEDAFASKYYDEDVGGFNLGEDILIDDELVPIPSNVGYSTCLRNKGLDPERAQSVVQFGSAKLQLKCHKTKGGIKYFNACVLRDEIKAKPFIINGKELEDPLSQLANTQLDGYVVAELERAGKTGGWCSTGAAVSGTPGVSMSGAKFEYRGIGEFNKFVFATDGDSP